jgi:hypothetical protein
MPPKRPTRKTTKLKRATTAVKPPNVKLDLYAKHKNEYVASEKKPGMVRVGPARYLSMSGKSAPATEPFDRAVNTLYGVAFAIKMARKAAGQDYTVTKLEGLWKVDSPIGEWSAADNIWNWELLLRVPTFVTQKEVRDTVEQLIAKGKDTAAREVKLVDYQEGECVQMLHIGPYAAEQETIGKMRAFAEFAGRSFDGRHHEIYLSDPRRVKPEKLRTILRQPVS